MIRGIKMVTLFHSNDSDIIANCFVLCLEEFPQSETILDFDGN